MTWGLGDMMTYSVRYDKHMSTEIFEIGIAFPLISLVVFNHCWRLLQISEIRDNANIGFTEYITSM